MKYKASVIQIKYIPNNKEAALEKLENLLKEAGEDGSKLVCLPEYSLTVYPKPEWAEAIPGPSTERLGKICKKYGMYLVAGSMVEKEGNKFYNTIPLIGANGEVIGKYRKINLLNWPPKKELDANLSRGGEILVFKTDIGNLGLLCGADLDPCEPCRILALKDCDILLAPHSCTGEWVDAHRYIAKCRAWESMFYVLAPNPCSSVETPYGKYFYLGSSAIISPMGEVVANAGEFYEGIATTTINLDLVKQIKAENQWKIERFFDAYKPLADSLTKKQ